MECFMDSLRTTKFGNGFVKDDVLSYLTELNSKIESLESKLRSADIPIPEECKFGSEVGVLRTTKIGGGFVKDDVLICLDEINNKKYALEESIKSAEAFFSEDYDNTSDTSDFFKPNLSH